MTNIYLEQDGDRYTVSARGHATGSVETCAAVSALVYSLAGWLHNATVLTLTERLDPGDACITFTGGENAGTAFDLITVGFLQLEKTDPQHITVKFEFIS